jgi:predicted ATPase
MAPLRGRDAESAELSALISAIADEAGGIMILTGAAGIGKTRLLAEAARTAAGRGIQVAQGAADELDRVSPWAPLLQTLSPAVLQDADLSSVSALLDQRLAVIDLLGAAIETAARSRPLLIMLDDLQAGGRALRAHG